MPRDEPMYLSLRGHVEMTDFLGLGDLLAKRHAVRPFSNVLFDWSEVESWNFRLPAAAELEIWLQDADFIDCVAIVHHRGWNRQAAWFAAVLRKRGCHVRSYRLLDHGRAAMWLREGGMT
jgi:hypothetical protein